MELDGHTGLEHFIIKRQIFFGSYAFYNSLIVSRGKDVSRMVVVVVGGGVDWGLFLEICRQPDENIPIVEEINFILIYVEKCFLFNTV